MGKRGPAPQPSILKYMRGNPSKEALNANEPTPDLFDDMPPPPLWLEGPALQKWLEVTPVLTRMRVLTEADVETVARYCTLWEQWKKNYDYVKRNGDVLTIFEPDPADPEKKRQRVKYMQVTPYASQMTKLAVLLLRIEQEFGLTPSSRSQVTIHADRESDPLASFVKERSRGAGA